MAVAVASLVRACAERDGSGGGGGSLLLRCSFVWANPALLHSLITPPSPRPPPAALPRPPPPHPTPLHCSGGVLFLLFGAHSLWTGVPE